MTVMKYAGALSSDLPSLKLPNVEAWMKDFATSSNGAGLITFGLFRISKGQSLPYLYEFDEFKLVVEGEVTVTDTHGSDIEFKAGDVIQFSKGDNVSFSSKSTGLAFYVAQR